MHSKSHLVWERLEYLIQREFNLKSILWIFHPLMLSLGSFPTPHSVLSFSLPHCSHCLSVSTLSLEGQSSMLRTRCHLQKTMSTSSPVEKHGLYFNSIIFWRKQDEKWWNHSNHTSSPQEWRMFSQPGERDGTWGRGLKQPSLTLKAEEGGCVLGMCVASRSWKEQTNKHRVSKKGHSLLTLWCKDCFE